MDKTLGIDTGTNSLGWAIVKREGEECHLVEKGVDIFQEGVEIEKGIEKSRAAERTEHRRTRIGYYRRKVRKTRLLRILSDNQLCPPLSQKELSDWRLHKIYPKDNELFMQWQRTDDVKGVNPYSYRHKCLHEKLDLTDLSQRYILGRAIYHINQRRGYHSNLPNEDDDSDGKVREGIGSLTEAMHEAGCEYLGDYFYMLYNKGEKIRNHYTSREDHYKKELLAICSKQGLDEELTTQLHDVIIKQRDLKSKKGEVGRCTFEKNKYRCPASHPLFEEFRMLSFLNNVRIQTPQDGSLRPLNAEERAVAMGKFYRKSEPYFDFEDIAKAIAGKNKYGYYKDGKDNKYLFNYQMDTSVKGCPVTAHLRGIFGDDWRSGICEVYTYKENKKPKTETDIINDVWHALYFSKQKEKDKKNSKDKLKQFATSHFQLGDDEAEKFADITMPDGYASLSLKAIKKILVFLRRGLIYSHAVFMANLGDVLPRYVWEVDDMREAAVDNVIKCLDEYKPLSDGPTIETWLKDYLKSQYNVSDDDLKRLYHPSMIDLYPKRRPGDNGIYQLGSPRTDSVRNPMAMRSLFRMRKLVNRLLSEKIIDENTTINIEFARELNDANRRKAIARMNKDNQTNRRKARNKIRELYKKETGRDIEPTDNDVLKYLLWEEQNHQCIYTGKTIGIADFIGDNPIFDIEHTIPQGVGGDSTQMNLTLCDSRFNRDVKKERLPSQLYNHDEILQRIDEWKEKYGKLDHQAHRLKKGSETTKEAKDSRIQRRHLLELQRDYWKGKYERFTMTEVPEGFSRRQGTDISVISRYARLYLKSVFKKVYIVKGIATHDFRIAWGLQDEYEKKQRDNHVHHCIDAITIACIGRNEYARLARYYHEADDYKYNNSKKPTFDKPWPTFVEDIKRIQDEILVAHYTPDNMPKQGRRRAVINGCKVLIKGDAARGSLHNDTYYGAIIPNNGNGKVRYVKRMPLSELDSKEKIESIVDEKVKSIIKKAIADKGFAKAMAEPIWMNEEKRIPIKKVRCFQKPTNPIHIRPQRDASTKEYKRMFHVANDRNYLMAIYIGKDKKGKEKRDYELVSNLDAAKFFKTSNDKSTVGGNIVPLKSKHDYPLAFTLKIGTMLLLYENNPEEIWEGSQQERVKRLYKVVGMEGDGRINMVYHQEARQSEDVNKERSSCFMANARSPKLRISYSKIHALVEGIDFSIDETGKLKRLR